jgi:hypothetical protein
MLRQVLVPCKENSTEPKWQTYWEENNTLRIQSSFGKNCENREYSFTATRIKRQQIWLL